MRVKWQGIIIGMEKWVRLSRLVGVGWVGVGLSNRLGWVGFVFGLNLNGLKTPQPESDLFNERVEQSNLKPD